jgi:hypothetical protein
MCATGGTVYTGRYAVDFEGSLFEPVGASPLNCADRALAVTP